PRDSNGNWTKAAILGEQVENPVANSSEIRDFNTTSRVVGNVVGELTLSDALKLRSTFGGTFGFDGIEFYAPRTVASGLGPGRANYSLKDKYLFTVTGRTDGSSRFGRNNKWAFFPSAAFAWRVSEEPFMQHQSLFGDVKLRLSYGKTGNQAIDPYNSLSRLGICWYSLAGTEINALCPSGTRGNPDLKWETQRQPHVGIDASVLRGRIAVSVDAYHSVTNDL